MEFMIHQQIRNDPSSIQKLPVFFGIPRWVMTILNILTAESPNESWTTRNLEQCSVDYNLYTNPFTSQFITGLQLGISYDN